MLLRAAFLQLGLMAYNVLLRVEKQRCDLHRCGWQPARQNRLV